MAAPPPPITCNVRYQGFVNVQSSASVMPGVAQVEKAYALLKKPKEARKLHPLFARGFATDLCMRISEAGIKVTVQAPDGMPVSVFDHPCHRVSYVVAIDRTMLFIALRPMMDGGDKSFKCHAFLTASNDIAKNLARHLTSTCTAVFRKLQHSRKVLRNREPKMSGAGASLAAALSLEASAIKTVASDVKHEIGTADSSGDSLKSPDEIEFDTFADDFANVSLSLQPQAAKAEVALGAAHQFDTVAADHVDQASQSNAAGVFVFDEVPSLDSDYFSFGIDV